MRRKNGMLKGVGLSLSLHLSLVLIALGIRGPSSYSRHDVELTYEVSSGELNPETQPNQPSGSSHRSVPPPALSPAAPSEDSPQLEAETSPSKSAPASPTDTARLGSSSGTSIETFQSGSATAAYLERARTRVQSRLRYPHSLRRQGLGGTVHLQVELAPDGRVLQASVNQGSGHERLDQLALSLIEEAAPFDAFSPEMPRSSLTFHLPVEFRP